MKRIATAFFLLINFSLGAQSNTDSLYRELTGSNDTARYFAAVGLWKKYVEIMPDSALVYSAKQIQIAEKLKLRLLVGDAYDNHGYALMVVGKFNESLKSMLMSISVYEKAKFSSGDVPSCKWLKNTREQASCDAEITRLNGLGDAYHDLGHLYTQMEQYTKAIGCYSKTIMLAKEIPSVSMEAFATMNLGRAFYYKQDIQTALKMARRSFEIWPSQNDRYFTSMLNNLGQVFIRMNEADSARKYLFWSHAAAIESKNERSLGRVQYNLGLFYLTINKLDSAKGYVYASLDITKKLKLRKDEYMADTLLAQIHKRSGNSDSAWFYMLAASKLRESLFNGQNTDEMMAIVQEDNVRKQAIEAANRDYKIKLQKYGFLAGITFLFIVAMLLMYNNRQRSKANQLLSEKKSELEETVNQLQTTQRQLVHAEKMASLGELTAGIAHEIQNPLNFINNFSEVNREMVAELKDEISQSSLPENKKQPILLLIDKILQNEAKILHHGKRADSIVKGMLQHSRSSTGKKEPVDINALADEYLRLSYHGLRAKDKSFNADIETSYDPSVGVIPVLPQDLGRVFLNLFTNAFYSVSAKKKSEGMDYKPIVSVNTKRNGSFAEISISDNGIGIKQSHLNKIFQPFFTTKPTGEGTGLGLSLSYEIITQGHGGTLRVNTQEGVGAEFIISIPVEINPVNSGS